MPCVRLACLPSAPSTFAPEGSPMAELIPCPSCGKGLSLPRQVLGKKVRCQACREAFLAPSALPGPLLPPSPGIPYTHGERAVPVTARKDVGGKSVRRRRERDRGRKSGESSVALIVAGVIAGVLLLGGVAVGTMLAFSRSGNNAFEMEVYEKPILDRKLEDWVAPGDFPNVPPGPIDDDF
jgi:hypothetical protein